MPLLYYFEKGGAPVDKLGKVDDFETDMDANASAFEALERDFQDVIINDFAIVL